MTAVCISMCSKSSTAVSDDQESELIKRDFVADGNNCELEQ